MSSTGTTVETSTPALASNPGVELYPSPPLNLSAMPTFVAQDDIGRICSVCRDALPALTSFGNLSGFIDIPLYRVTCVIPFSLKYSCVASRIARSTDLIALRCWSGIINFSPASPMFFRTPKTPGVLLNSSGRISPSDIESDSSPNSSAATSCTRVDRNTLFELAAHERTTSEIKRCLIAFCPSGVRISSSFVFVIRVTSWSTARLPMAEISISSVSIISLSSPSLPKYSSACFSPVTKSLNVFLRCSFVKNSSKTAAASASRSLSLEPYGSSISTVLHLDLSGNAISLLPKLEESSVYLDGLLASSNR